MGKSPGKWIKTVLLGKKRTRSNGAKARTISKAGDDKGYTIAKELPASTENSPVISEPILVSTHSNEVNPDQEHGSPPNVDAETAIMLATIIDAENQGVSGPTVLNNPERFREEQAATMAQAAFRGFLARRAFRTLKGIVRLQALVRGHLVRRQAAVTLHSTLGILKFQALVRGQKVRSSDLSLEVNAKFGRRKAEVPKHLVIRKNKLYSNAFVCKLLSSSLVTMPLRINYNQEEPNSVFNWMQRWTFSCFWKLPFQPQKVLESKSQSKRSSCAMETESGRQKRNIRRNSSSNVDTSEPTKPKRIPKKVIATTDSVQENLQSELEKVKRNLRKVSSSYAEICDDNNKPEIEIDAQSHNVDNSLEKMKKKVNELIPGSKYEPIPMKKKDNNNNNNKAEIEIDAQSHNVNDSIEKIKKENESTPEPKSEPKPIIAVKELIGPFADNPRNKLLAEEINPVVNGELSIKEEQSCNESQKTSKRISSFSTNSECNESSVQNTSKVPSYMQATESAKAKLRQNSPRFGSDSNDKDGATRRHSLPSSTNGKVTSNSPRTQKILQGSGKGSIRSDRSLSFSRDANEKPIQVEWRR